jgi:hypothetical protein
MSKLLSLKNLFLVGLSLAATQFAGAASYTTGDLLLGFRALGGDGATINYVVNVGAASAYRDGTISGTVTVGDIATDLAVIYGADWYTRTDVQWSVVGSPSNTSTVNGDPSKTIYYTIPNGSSTSGLAMGSTLRGTASTNMVALERGTTGFASTSYTNATTSAYAKVTDTTSASSWTSYMNGGANVGGRTVDFDAFAEVEGLPGTSLGFYRSSTASAGTFLGTFHLSSSGTLTFTPATTSVTYSTWAATNVGGQTEAQDYDGDGIPNGVEFFMGSNAASFTANPQPVNGVITWPKASGISITSYTVQTSEDLVNWTDVSSTSGASSVSYTLPTGYAKLFVRLKVVP